MTAAPAFEIVEEQPSELLAYARISSAFQVREIVDIAEAIDGPGQFVLSRRKLEPPYTKDYDAIAEDRPGHWPRLFDLSHWRLFSARLAGQRLGGAAAVFDAPDMDLLEGRRDLALLWDIRVAPEARGRGVGSALFRAVEDWARSKGCRALKIETQNSNAPACAFYAQNGCVLGSIQRSAYQRFPDEVQMFWYKDLDRPRRRRL